MAVTANRRTTRRRLARSDAWRRAALAGVIAALALLHAAAQQADRQKPGTVSGVIVDATTGVPLGDAVATLWSAPAAPGAPPASRRVVADARGRFTFTDCPPGTYMLTATRAGYVAGAAGRTRPGGPQSPFDLSAGQAVDVGRILLWSHSAITGRIIDEFGDPVVNANVRAFPVRRVAGALKYSSLSASYWAKTDDRGEYRIAGIAPGAYAVAVLSTIVTVPPDYVRALLDADPETRTDRLGGYGRTAASVLRASGDAAGARVMAADVEQVVVSLGPLRTGDGRLKAVTTTFYPGTDIPSDAQPVQVRGYGTDVRADFSVTRRLTAQISGTVLRDDTPVAGALVRLLHESDVFESVTGLDAAVTVSERDGAFRFLGVPPGRYVIVSSTTTATRPRTDTIMTTATGEVRLPGASVSSGPADRLWAVESITVGAEAIDGCVLRLVAGPRLNGRIEFRTNPSVAPPAQTGPLAITFQIEEGIRVAGPWTSRIGPDGSFSSEGLPAGRYVVSLTGVPRGWEVVSVDAGGVDLTLNSFSPADVDRPLIVRLEPAETVLTGTVAGFANDGSRTMVLVFPTDRALWTKPAGWSRRVRASAVTPAGGYRIAGLPAGDYFVAALEEAEPDDMGDPAYLNTVASKATRVTIVRGQTLNLVLQMQR